MGAYQEAYTRAKTDPDAFWGEAAEAIAWRRVPTRVLEREGETGWSWFPDGELNTCENAVDRHVEAGRGDQAAVIYDSPVTGAQRTLTYAELLDEVARFAGALVGLGVGKGDRVVIYLPMIPEAVVAMLACARIGAVHSVVFGGFAPDELRKRIDDAQPEVIVTASCGIEGKRVIEYKPLVDAAVAEAEHRPAACVVLQREQARAELGAGDHDWTDLAGAAQPADCVPVAATDPLYVLYTSGTTGTPKGIVRDNGGHAVALRYTISALYDTQPGEVYWAASDVGWVVGHSYIVYAPLITGCTTIVYEGKPVGTPDPGAFWRVISEHGVSTLFTAPTAFRAIRKEDPQAEHLGRYDLSDFRALFLAGERLDPETYQWAVEKLQVPVVDHWWQTETGWAIAGNLIGLERLEPKPGSACVPCPGWDVRILDPAGEEAAADAEGAVVCKLPLPPGASKELWNRPGAFEASYLRNYPGYYETGDGGHVDEDGYLFVMGRIDDVINVAGHRLSTGAMEEVCASHPDVAEVAVIGHHDELKGQLPMAFVVLKAGVTHEPEAISAELVQLVRERIGAVAAFRQVEVVDRLPKTRSGKILRAAMRKIADGEQVAVPSTIEDPAALDEIADVLGRRVAATT
ncbi:MAG: AMP-binding protein [Nocardioidaceae bacterium]